MAVICVTIFNPAGRAYTHVTSGKSLYEGVGNAMDFFRNPFWKGPKPRPDTMFEVMVVGQGSRYWHVRASRVEEWRRNQADLSQAI